MKNRGRMKEKLRRKNETKEEWDEAAGWDRVRRSLLRG